MSLLSGHIGSFPAKLLCTSWPTCVMRRSWPQSLPLQFLGARRSGESELDNLSPTLHAAVVHLSVTNKHKPTTDWFESGFGLALNCRNSVNRVFLKCSLAGNDSFQQFHA